MFACARRYVSLFAALLITACTYQPDVTYDRTTIEDAAKFRTDKAPLRPTYQSHQFVRSGEGCFRSVWSRRRAYRRRNSLGHIWSGEPASDAFYTWRRVFRLNARNGYRQSKRAKTKNKTA